MSLEKTYNVDAIGIETETNNVVLTLTDSWDWRDEVGHLIALQAKLNRYLEFIESGQLCEEYPAAEGRQVKVNIIFRFAPPASAVEFISIATSVAADISVLMQFDVFTDTNAGVTV